jgi:hypothetical protein
MIILLLRFLAAGPEQLDEDLMVEQQHGIT